MTTALPKWVILRYARLWRKFEDTSFSHEQASNFLNEPKRTTLSLIIQELKSSGWITIILDPKDARKRLYALKKPEQAINELK